MLDHSLRIELGEPQVLELPQRRIRVQEQMTFEVTDFEVTRRYDRYTPYQPWRELYEIPLGVVAVVAGVGANVLNVVMLGNMPESATRDWISYGFAGINPFMNAESNGRSQQNLASLDEQRRDARLEYTSLPWAERPVLVSAGPHTHELSTDRHGVLRLNLLDGPFADQDVTQIGKLQLSVEDEQDGTRAEATLLVSHKLRGKLQEAHDLIFDDLEGDDVAQWVHRVRRLSELGLEEEASELEQSLIELTRNDPELQQHLKTPALLLALLLVSALPAAANIRQAPEPELRDLMQRTVAEADSFQDRFDAEVWLVDMSGRLKRYIPDAEERLSLLRLVHREASKAGLKPELVLALIHAESLFDRFAISSVGAQGMMQVMPFWKAELGRPQDNLTDNATNLRYGCTILSYYLNKENGDINRALARYNGSLGQNRYPAKVIGFWQDFWYVKP